MFPLRDSIQASRVPIVTIALILVNVLVFAWQAMLGPGMEGFVVQYALVPDRLFASFHGQIPVLPQLATVFSSMFLHAGLLHVLGNMWFLWIFGDNVEDRFGRLGFLAFYLACGMVAAASQLALTDDPTIPMIGASGAIAGVLGAYARLFPQSRVLTIVILIFIVQFVELPALIFLGLWLVIQVVSSLGGEAGVAWWAHIAGFGAGFLLSFVVARAPVQYRARKVRVGRW